MPEDVLGAAPKKYGDFFWFKGCKVGDFFQIYVDNILSSTYKLGQLQ